MTRTVHRVSDGPLCTACAVLLDTPAEVPSRTREANDIVVESELPLSSEKAVEHGFPSMNKMAVEHGFPSMDETTVERELPSTSESAVGPVPLPFPAGVRARAAHPRAIGASGHSHSHLEGGDASSDSSSCDDSTLPASKCGQRKKKKSKHRRRMKASSPTSNAPSTMESVCVMEYVVGAPHQQRVVKVANPPCDASSLTRLPGLSWKNFLRDLKHGEVEQVCPITTRDEEVHTVSDHGDVPRPKRAEPKSAREERFSAQSWESLEASSNPVYNLAREYEDVFPDKIPAELPVDRGVRHEIDFTPGTKYCVTRDRRIELVLRRRSYARRCRP
ncbi:unnamed protein product [Phytophthora lilii]|uniref:Unnamed protein product n=1 Tax=Phytophthora lilii TaxID=2077276 RepID=A0A9W7CW11_9STRA|nr:unnamed protein product [Phytophthora lilii]